MSITAIADTTNPPMVLTVGEKPATILLTIEADGSATLVFMAIPNRDITVVEVQAWIAENPTVDGRSFALKVVDPTLLADLGTAATVGAHHLSRMASEAMGEAKGNA